MSLGLWTFLILYGKKKLNFGWMHPGPPSILSLVECSVLCVNIVSFKGHIDPFSIHQSISYTHLSFRGLHGGWNRSQLTLGESTPWTGRRSITGLWPLLCRAILSLKLDRRLSFEETQHTWKIKCSWSLRHMLVKHGCRERL